ncbi:MAG TPA: MBL fold metallo-hydrolase [Kofleriaceae bacterium]|nr:MBL fold metallo-hydrolase [Kofleriaceae bacterium]
MTRLRMVSAAGRAIGIDVSAYVVRGVMIDTGFAHAREALLRAARSLSVRAAIVTHWHEDHAGNVSTIAALGVPIALRADTEAVLRSFPPIELYRRVVWGAPLPLGAPIQGTELDGLVCVHTPGHSVDHQIVWDPSTRSAFTGDLWLGVRARTVHSTEDPYTIVESLRTLRDLRPARMFDAHRGLIEPAVEAIDRKIEWLSMTLATIESRIVAGDDDSTIVRRVLGGEDLAAVVSRGSYSRRNLVRSVRRRTRLGSIG